MKNLLVTALALTFSLSAFADMSEVAFPDRTEKSISASQIMATLVRNADQVIVRDEQGRKTKAKLQNVLAEKLSAQAEAYGDQKLHPVIDTNGSCQSLAPDFPGSLGCYFTIRRTNHLVKPNGYKLVGPELVTQISFTGHKNAKGLEIKGQSVRIFEPEMAD